MYQNTLIKVLVVSPYDTVYVFEIHVDVVIPTKVKTYLPEDVLMILNLFSYNRVPTENGKPGK